MDCTMDFLETENVFPVRHFPQELQFSLPNSLFTLFCAHQQQTLAIPRSDPERVIEEMEWERDRIKPKAPLSQGQSSGILLLLRSC